MEVVFYDGACGLCHATVRFLLERDRRGLFAYAPIGGATFLRTFPEAERASIPDSLVVRTSDGRTLVRSSALAHLLKRLDGGWRSLGALLCVVPRPLGDL